MLNPTYLGLKYNRLTIIGDAGYSKSGNILCLAECDCGVKKNILLGSIIAGKTKSCGCLRVESNKNKIHRQTHGLNKHPLFSVWVDMRKRCYNKNCKYYKRYGGNGVTVCEEWKYEFLPFYNWAISNGWAQGLYLDKDKLAPNSMGKLYSPDYCSFLTRDENMRYRTDTIKVTYKSETKSLMEWCSMLGLPYKRMVERINIYKWEPEKAFSTPVRRLKNNISTPKLNYL